MIYERLPINCVGDFLKNRVCFEYKRAYDAMCCSDMKTLKTYIYNLPITEYYKDVIWEFLNDDEDGLVTITKWLSSPKRACFYYTDDLLRSFSEFGVKIRV